MVWAVFEAGLDFWALMARLAAFLVVGLWFVAPWTKALYEAKAESKVSYRRWNLIASALGAVLLVVAAFQAGPVESGSNFGQVKGNGVTDWRAYGGTTLSTRFAEIDQINTGNVGRLKEIWRYRTKVPFDFKDTPQEVDGLVYVCTAGNTVIALDADTGTEVWRRATSAKVPGGSGANGLENASTFARTCRGLGYYDASAPARTAQPATQATPVAKGSGRSRNRSAAARPAGRAERRTPTAPRASHHRHAQRQADRAGRQDRRALRQLWQEWRGRPLGRTGRRPAWKLHGDLSAPGRGRSDRGRRLGDG